MPDTKGYPKQLIRDIFSCDLDDKIEIENKRRELLINIICIIGIINLVPLGFYALSKGILKIGSFDLFVALVLMNILLFLRKKGYHIFCSYLGITIAGALFIYLFASGGFNNTGHVWYFTFPLFTLFLLGSKKGTIATSIFFCFAIIIFALQNQPFVVAAYSKDFQIRFLSSFIVVSSLSVSFEYIRERTQQRLGEKNRELQKTISELKATESALHENETLLRATLESTADGILVVDDLGRVISRNTRFGDMWQISPEILEKNDDELLLNSILTDLKEPKQFLLKVQELYKSDKHDFDVLEFNDGRIFERYSEPLIVNQNIAGRVWSFRDITERKKAEKEKAKLQSKLQEAEKMKAIGTLAGGVAHDLNNILSGIVSYPELILLDLPEDSPLRNSIKTIHDSGKKAAAIVQDLLTLARRGVSTSETVNLNDIISEYLISPEFEKLKKFHPLVKIETCLDSNLLNLIGSPIHLSKTIMNLVSNAAEAITAEGIVSIKTEGRYIDQPVIGYDKINEGNYAVLTVSDTGVGIASEDIGRIFEPFYTKKVMGRSGTGLGMAVVWGSVKDHNGYINVESVIEKGTTFKLYFPATKREKAAEQKPKKLLDLSGNGETILIVDDVREQREVASRILSKLGYSVKLASSGEEALIYMRKNSADLVVMDMIMSPGIDGLETYEQIISMHPKQKAIIVSGFSETNRVKKLQQLGAGPYVRKPYTIENIGLAVKSELEKEKEAA